MRLILILILSMMITAPVKAKTLWSDFSVSYLTGNDYEVGDSDREVATFEYASGTTWGDNFLFFDRLESANGDVSTYGEFSPRFKIADLENSVVESLFIASTVEVGPKTNYLLGVGTNLNLPIFKYFKVNLYYKNNGEGDANYQTTIAWALPLGPLFYDGFIDYATGVDNTASGDTKAQMNMTSQLKYDLAPLFDMTTKLYVGIEYVFWVNKFGIDGVDEKNANLLVKYHF
ncbi:outer membrane protein OmpK [Colwellia sp. KU-HH00111]|uniref:nucleoside-binding protein n=1 Tax=Colwellia sp. KU-HH00111 TaxID=3127652 RepID=UPI003108A4F2